MSDTEGRDENSSGAVAPPIDPVRPPRSAYECAKAIVAALDAVEGETDPVKIREAAKAYHMTNATHAPKVARVLIALIGELEGGVMEYLEDRFDTVDGPDGQPRPNTEMSLHTGIREALGELP